MNASELLSSDNFALRRSSKKSKDLILAFVNADQKGRMKGKPAFRGAGAEILFINCHRLPPQKGNLDALLNMIPQLTDEVRSIVESIAPQRIFAVGYSLSAFPAIVVGAELKAERIIAMSPETLIGMHGSRSAKRLGRTRTTYPNADLRIFLKERKPKDVRIIAGELDVVDLYAARRLSKLPNIHIYTLPGVSHGTFNKLNRDGTLNTLIKGIAEPEFILDSSPGNLTLRPHVKDWYRAIKGLRSDPASAEQQLRRIIDDVPDNVALLRHLSRALMFQGRTEEAVQYLEKAAAIAPADPHVVKLLDELNRRPLLPNL